MGSLLKNSILWGNTIVGSMWEDEGGFAFNEYCAYDLHGNPFPPPSGPGVITLDPQFVDAANGDYRLRFGSPCIDAGDPAATLTRDVDGRARPIDGNLDTAERSDIGALEMAPLELVTSGAIGTSLRLELRGPTGAPIQVLFSRRAPVSPQATPWGEFDLDPAQYGPFLNSTTGGEPPTVYQRLIPPSPSLVGRTFSFQGLVTSAAAPQGFAYTNVVTFTIVP